MSSKPKVAFYWCASCGGCEEAVVDLAEKILDAVAAVDIVFWPVALDFKRKDVEAMEDGAILATFLNGAIRTSEQEEMAHLLRRKSTLLIALGSCSHMGGIPGLANLFGRESILQCVYPDGVRPQPEFRDNGHLLTLPVFGDTVKALDQVVEVDAYLPGCPPTPKLFWQAVETLLGGTVPPRGAVLAPDHALCDQCPRKDTRPETLAFTRFRRPHEIQIDPEKCMMAQEVLCMGPVTRAGCEAQCLEGNMPCTGCFGPTSRVRDVGGKALASVASLVAATDPAQIERTLESIPDPLGTFYRYSLPSSILRGRRAETSHA